MKPAATTTSVVVADVTPMVNLTDSTMSHVIDHTKLEQLPRADRLLQNVLNTVPGFEGWLSSGLRCGSTDFQLDGAPLVSRTRGTIENRQPGLDSIEELSVDTYNVSAKYNSPVAVTLSTKSGTNELHGSAFEIDGFKRSLSFILVERACWAGAGASFRGVRFWDWVPSAFRFLRRVAGSSDRGERSDGERARRAARADWVASNGRTNTSGTMIAKHRSGSDRCFTQVAGSKEERKRGAASL